MQEVKATFPLPDFLFRGPQPYEALAGTAEAPVCASAVNWSGSLQSQRKSAQEQSLALLYFLPSTAPYFLGPLQELFLLLTDCHFLFVKRL